MSLSVLFIFCILVKTEQWFVFCLTKTKVTWQNREPLTVRINPILQFGNCSTEFTKLIPGWDAWRRESAVCSNPPQLTTTVLQKAISWKLTDNWHFKNKQTHNPHNSSIKWSLMPLTDHPPFPQATGRQEGQAPLGPARSGTQQHSQAVGARSPRKEAASSSAPLQKGCGRSGTSAFGGLWVHASQPLMWR